MHVVLFPTGNPTLGVDNFVADKKAISAFPNPVKEMLNLTCEAKMDRITIMNMLGQVYADQNADSNNFQMDMSSFPTGNYLVKVTSEKAVKTMKVIKQ